MPNRKFIKPFKKDSKEYLLLVKRNKLRASIKNNEHDIYLHRTFLVNNEFVDGIVSDLKTKMAIVNNCPLFYFDLIAPLRCRNK